MNDVRRIETFARSHRRFEKLICGASLLRTLLAKIVATVRRCYYVHIHTTLFVGNNNNIPPTFPLALHKRDYATPKLRKVGLVHCSIIAKLEPANLYEMRVIKERYS